MATESESHFGGSVEEYPYYMKGKGGHVARATVAEDELGARRKMGEQRFAAYVAEADEGDMRVARWLASPHRKTVPWTNNRQEDYTPEQMEAWANCEPSAAFMEMPELEKAPMDYTPEQLIVWAPVSEHSLPKKAAESNELKGAVSRLPDRTELRCDVSMREIAQADEHAALPRAEQRALRQRGKFNPMKLADLAKLRRKKGTDLAVFARNNKLIAKLDEDDEAVAILGKNGEIIRHAAHGLSFNFEGLAETWAPVLCELVGIGAVIVYAEHTNSDPNISGCIAFDPADEQQVKLILKHGGILPKKRGTEESRAKAGERLKARHAARRAAAQTVVPEIVPEEDFEPAFV